jgi:7-cyano-7-deazaguanine synthase
MDSTVCLLLAREKGREVTSVGIDYGQQAREELIYAERLCTMLEVPRKVLTVRWDKPLRRIPVDRSPQEMSQDISTAFLPGRNALFLVLGCAEAAGIGASEVWIGINSVDYSGYPDCREEFVDVFRRMIDLAIPGAPKIITPLLSMAKPEIAREAKRFGLQELDTWSCYRPVRRGSESEPCGRCDGCVLHAYAWANIQASREDAN